MRSHLKKVSIVLGIGALLMCMFFVASVFSYKNILDCRLDIFCNIGRKTSYSVWKVSGGRIQGLNPFPNYVASEMRDGKWPEKVRYIFSYGNIFAVSPETIDIRLNTGQKVSLVRKTASFHLIDDGYNRSSLPDFYFVRFGQWYRRIKVNSIVRLSWEDNGLVPASSSKIPEDLMKTSPKLIGILE